MQEQIPVWQYQNLTLINGDFLKVGIPDDAIDLVVTSPPYNTGKEYGESYNDSLPYPEYLQLMRNWLREVYRILKPDGRVCWNIPLDTSKNRIHRPVYAHVVNIFEEIGFQYRPTITWLENNFSKSTAWGTFTSAQAPYGLSPVEKICVFYKHQWPKTTKGSLELDDLTKQEHIRWSRQLWEINGENRGKTLGNPAPWPPEIPRRLIKLYSYKGDLVLDPFVGSGTTLSVCHKLERRGIGIEINSIEPALRNITRDCNLDPDGWIQTDQLVLPSHTAA